jgi:RNA polymerase sigma-70 factor, ECF subfamily
MSLLLDITGFEALFQVNYQPLCTTSFRIVQDKDIAEDIVQDIFIKLWERRETLVIETSLKAYLIRSTINQSLNYLKKYRNTLEREFAFGAEIGAESNVTEDTVLFRELSKKAEQAISALPEGCRLVFVLSRHEQLSYREISARLNISVKTVENQMSRALRHLRRYLLPVAALILKIFLR